MPHSENPRSPSEIRGRGTGETHYSSSTDFNTEREEVGYVYKKGKGEFETLPVPRPLFDPTVALPYAADPKGKDTALFDRTLVAPNAKPWHALDATQVRYRATTTPAVLLSKGERQAAARDPGLEWCETARCYRPRRVGSPTPSLATGGNAEGREGESKSLAASTSQTGGCV
jgi:hypothetical protein